MNKNVYEVEGVTVRNFGVPDLTEEEMTHYVEYCKARIKTVERNNIKS